MTASVIEGGADIEVVFCFGVDANIVVASGWKFLIDGLLWFWEWVGVDENFWEVEDGRRDRYFWFPADADFVDLVFGDVALKVEGFGDAFADCVMHLLN
jgi:hypothetical protein